MKDSHLPTKSELAKKTAPEREHKTPNVHGTPGPSAVDSTNVQQAVGNLSLAQPATILRLQRMAGNQAVQRKLMVGAAHDPYEQEADHMAQQVMSTPAAQVQRWEEDPEGTLMPKRLISSISRLAQRAPEEEEEVQTRRQAQRAPEEEEEVQTRRQVQRASEEE